MGSKIEEKCIKHYSSRHKILLVGEGDFSFALSLANAFGSASNMVATSRDSKGSLVLKYSRASAILKELESLDCTILHEVDAHTTHKHPLLQHKLFDRIVYNFPHAGFRLSESNPHQIVLHQKVVLGFLKSARKMLTHDGEVHVTHKNNNPFCDWEIVKLAEKASLILVEKVSFERFEYPGYVNKRGSGNNCDGSFRVGDSSTFKFSKPKDVESLASGLAMLLLDPEPLQLINYDSKIKLLPENRKGRSRKGRSRMDSKMEEKWMNHYSSCQKILLVGEGDFSFALCLAKAFGSASNMVATSLDARGSLILNYSRASAILKELENLGCTILHEVDALSMCKHPLLLEKFFDRIVFNFPQDVRFPFPEDTPYRIRQHKKLVSGFLQSARKMLSLSGNGEVHVTLKNEYPFCKWEVVKLGEKAGLVLVKKVQFNKQQYPGYNIKRGSGMKWDERFPVGCCCTFKFSKSRRDEESLVLGLSETSIHPNSVLQPKNNSVGHELNGNQMVQVWTPKNVIQVPIVSSSNTEANSDQISRRDVEIKKRTKFSKSRRDVESLVLGLSETSVHPHSVLQPKNNSLGHELNENQLVQVWTPKNVIQTPIVSSSNTEANSDQISRRDVESLVLGLPESSVHPNSVLQQKNNSVDHELNENQMVQVWTPTNVIQTPIVSSSNTEANSDQISRRDVEIKKRSKFSKSRRDVESLVLGLSETSVHPHSILQPKNNSVGHELNENQLVQVWTPKNVIQTPIVSSSNTEANSDQISRRDVESLVLGLPESSIHPNSVLQQKNNSVDHELNENQMVQVWTPTNVIQTPIVSSSNTEANSDQISRRDVEIKKRSKFSKSRRDVESLVLGLSETSVHPNSVLQAKNNSVGHELNENQMVQVWTPKKVIQTSIVSSSNTEANSDQISRRDVESLIVGLSETSVHPNSVLQPKNNSVGHELNENQMVQVSTPTNVIQTPNVSSSNTEANSDQFSRCCTIL